MEDARPCYIVPSLSGSRFGASGGLCALLDSDKNCFWMETLLCIPAFGSLQCLLMLGQTGNDSFCLAVVLWCYFSEVVWGSSETCHVTPSPQIDLFFINQIVYIVLLLIHCMSLPSYILTSCPQPAQNQLYFCKCHFQLTAIHLVWGSYNDTMAMIRKCNEMNRNRLCCWCFFRFSFRAHECNSVFLMRTVKELLHSDYVNMLYVESLMRSF